MRTCARSSRKITITILKSSRNAPRKVLTLRNKIEKEMKKGKKVTKMPKIIKWEIAKTTSLLTSLA